jgi:predicted Zn-dependent protease
MGMRSRPHLAMLSLAVVVILSLVVPIRGAQFDLKKLIRDAEEVKEKAEIVKEIKRFLPISTEEEIEIGKGVAARLQQAYGLYRDGPIERYVALVGTAVSWQGQRKELAYSFTILDTDEVNAFAAPGGYIMITRGLLARVRNEAELACVLGHEIWHVEARHEMKRVQQAQTAGTIANRALSAMSKEELLDVTDLCYSILEKGRSREVELEADVEGVRLASQVGYAPGAMEHFLARLKREPREGALSKLWATHPDMDERREELRSKYGREKEGALLSGRFETALTSLQESR